MDDRLTGFERRKVCVIIPTFNNRQTLAMVIGEVLGYTSSVIVVNDGSTDGTEQVLQGIPGIDVLQNPQNRGKGFSLRKAFRYALEKGYDYAITLDSDGQHLASDLPAFLEKLEQEPGSLLIGNRNMNVDHVPLKSSFGRRFSNFWITVMTGLRLPDTQSGFRLYPIRKMEKIKYVSRRFEFEVEVIVRAVWKGIRVDSVPVMVFYPPVGERVSHYRPFTDFMRISLLNTMLVALSLFIFWPRKIIEPYRGKSLRRILHDEIYIAGGSNVKLAASVGFGIFMGIFPVWGYQLLTGLVLAHFFRLNKAIFFVAANISLPPMIPLILFLSFYAGGLLLGAHGLHSFSLNEMNFAIAYTYLRQYLVGAVVLAAAAGFVFFLASYFLLAILRNKKYKS